MDGLDTDRLKKAASEWLDKSRKRQESRHRVEHYNEENRVSALPKMLQGEMRSRLSDPKLDFEFLTKEHYAGQQILKAHEKDDITYLMLSSAASKVKIVLQKVPPKKKPEISLVEKAPRRSRRVAFTFDSDDLPTMIDQIRKEVDTLGKWLPKNRPNDGGSSGGKDPGPGSSGPRVPLPDVPIPGNAGVALQEPMPDEPGAETIADTVEDPFTGLGRGDQKTRFPRSA